MRQCIAVLTAFLVAACSGGLRSNAPALHTYILRAHAPAAAPATQPAGASVQVELPTSAPGLGSEHIVIVQPDHRMSYYGGSEWAAELPRVVEELAVERLRATGDWALVNDSTSAFSSDYFLQVRIRRFEAEYSGDAAPTAQVALDCAIGRRADRVVLASFTATGAAAASANRVGAVIGAFELAANAALDEVTAGSRAVLRSSQVPSNP